MGNSLKKTTTETGSSLNDKRKELENEKSTVPFQDRWKEWCLNAPVQALKITNIGLVTPYVGSIQKRIIKNFEFEKFECVSERHFDMTDNFSFGEVSESTINKAAEEVIAEGAEAVIILCTNLSGAGIAALIEEKTGVPVLDSVVLTFWGALRSIGINTLPLVKWAPAVAKLDQKAN